MPAEGCGKASLPRQVPRVPRVRVRHGQVPAQDAEAALTNHALPKSPFINKLYQAIEADGGIGELTGLDHARLSVCLLDAVKALIIKAKGVIFFFSPV